jgi:hypothetical protein
MSATERPVSYIAAGRDPPKRVLCLFLGGHRYWSSVGETEVEDFACVGIYRVCACFYVVDALRPAIKEQPAPSKPVIPILDCSTTIAQMYRKVKKAILQTQRFSKVVGRINLRSLRRRISLPLPTRLRKILRCVGLRPAMRAEWHWLLVVTKPDF